MWTNVDLFSFVRIFKVLTMYSANKDTFTYFFVMDKPLISFSYFIALAKTSNMVLNRGDENESTCNISNIRRKAFNISLITMMLTINFS